MRKSWQAIRGWAVTGMRKSSRIAMTKSDKLLVLASPLDTVFV
jgi:hypothetical protein